MTSLLWLALGVLAGLLAWVVPILWPWLLVAFALAVVGFVFARPLTAIGAKLAIGTGAVYLVMFGPRVVSDPLGTSGETYLWFGFGLASVLIGTAAAWRNHRREARLRAAEARPT